MNGIGAEIRAREPIGRWRGPGQDRPPIVDALSVAALELGSFVRRQLGDDQQVEEVAVEVGRLPEELSIGQDKAVRSYREGCDLGLGPRLAEDVADDRGPSCRSSPRNGRGGACLRESS